MATASSLLGQSCTWKVSDKAVPGGGGGSACSALGLWLLRGEGGGRLAGSAPLLPPRPEDPSPAQHEGRVCRREASPGRPPSPVTAVMSGGHGCASLSRAHVSGHLASPGPPRRAAPWTVPLPGAQWPGRQAQAEAQRRSQGPARAGFLREVRVLVSVSPRGWVPPLAPPGWAPSSG